MTRIIAIVVVIVAAVVAYMYTSAGDVEVGEVPSASQPLGETDTDSAAVPGDEAEATNPAQEGAADTAAGEEVAAAEGEAATVEGEDAGLAAEQAAIEGEGAAAVEGDVLADTAETVPAEEGPAGDEPDAGVGAVSTEEETDGAGAAGITAEEGEQEGLAGTVTEEAAADDEAPAGTTLESSPRTTTATGEQALETPTGLDTTNDAAPEAVIPGEADAGAAVATTPDATGETFEDAAAADVDGNEAATDDATSTELQATGTPDIRAVDPGPALRTDAATTATTQEIDRLLDAENLDVPAVIDAINAADIEPAQRTQLIEALETAQDDPNLLSGVLDRIRTALTGG